MGNACSSDASVAAAVAVQQQPGSMSSVLDGAIDVARPQGPRAVQASPWSAGTNSSTSVRRPTAADIDLSKAMSLTPRKFARATDDDVEALRSARAHRVDWAVQGLKERKAERTRVLQRARQVHNQRNASAIASLPQQHDSSMNQMLPQAAVDAAGNSNSTSQVLDTWRGANEGQPFRLVTEHMGVTGCIGSPGLQQPGGSGSAAGGTHRSAVRGDNPLRLPRAVTFASAQ